MRFFRASILYFVPIHHLSTIQTDRISLPNCSFFFSLSNFFYSLWSTLNCLFGWTFNSVPGLCIVLTSSKMTHTNGAHSNNDERSFQNNSNSLTLQCKHTPTVRLLYSILHWPSTNTQFIYSRLRQIFLRFALPRSSNHDRIVVRAWTILNKEVTAEEKKSHKVPTFPMQDATIRLFSSYFAPYLLSKRTIIIITIIGKNTNLSLTSIVLLMFNRIVPSTPSFLPTARMLRVPLVSSEPAFNTHCTYFREIRRRSAFNFL